ncbi:hypothetical protein GQR58_029549 [Nymphon striatum]|nr:hypothetical protein GQR58_029549 [Nymphon striatum]
MERAAIIEKNRKKLICLVTYWLMAALCLRRAKATLPLRLSRWVGNYLFKLGSSGRLSPNCRQMRCIAAKHHHEDLQAAQIGKPFLIDDIVVRLKAIRAILCALASTPQTTTPYSKWQSAFFVISAKVPALFDAVFQTPKDTARDPPRLEHLSIIIPQNRFDQNAVTHPYA